MTSYEPHKYQTYATEFIETHNEAAVFLDCGLGKTVITLTALNDLMFDSFEFHKALIIAPLRVGKVSWPNELRKWEHLKDLTYSVVIGTEKERLDALNKEADIYIINRENVEWLVEKSGVPFEFQCVVIDELSSFKNHKAKRFRALLQVRPRIKRLIGLTGSPASNGLMDLWSEFRLMDMGLRLGRFITRFREAYFRPDKTNGQIVFSYKPLPGAEESIYAKIQDMTISMKSTDHLDMPELLLNEYRVSLSDKEMSVYRQLEDDFITELGGKEMTAANAATLTGKLTQLANGAIYSDDHEVIRLHDRKLDALEDLIEAQNGKPCLVSYWYRHDLDRIQERLTALKIPYELINTPESIERWNKGETLVGLMNPQSVGHGINLQDGGSTLIFFGLTWSLELWQQSFSRLWRQGQSSKTVVIEHIVTEGTVDEDILKALKRKDVTQSALLNAVKAKIGR